MGATVYYQNSNEIAILKITFTLSGVPADPTTVSCIVTDPTGNQVTHTFGGASPADITKTGTGLYQLNQACTTEGLWSYVWIGTGAVSDATAGTFTVVPTFLNRFYCSKEEIKSRIGLDPTDTEDDDQLLQSVAAACRGIDQFTGRYFWQGPDTRYFDSDTIEIATVDDLVSVTTLQVDNTGMNVFDTTWATTDYRLEPVNAPGFNPEPRPYTRIRALAGGGGHFYFPFTYPLSNPDRIKITGVFGWPAVPYLVKQVCLQAAEDIYKLKDAPFGVLGSAEMGLMRIQANPEMQDMLWSYVRGSKKVGM